MKFHLIGAGSRSLLAVPEVPRGLWGAGAACYPGHSWKKRMVRTAIGSAARLRLLPRIFPAGWVSLGEVAEDAFDGWLAALSQSLGFGPLHPVLVWPADPLRGRIYIHLLCAEGRRVAFCKLGLDDNNNRLIEREGRALSRLHALGLSASRIPALLASGELEGLRYLVVETTPPGARIIDWKRDPPITANIAEFAGPIRRVPAGEVGALSWWPAVQSRFSEQAGFLQRIEEATSQGVDVCLAHGDLNQTNVLRFNGETWLLDWEQCQQDAPCLTDTVCVAVDRLWMDQQANPSGNFRKFKNEFLDGDEAVRDRATLALAYLGAAGFTPALHMIHEGFGKNPRRTVLAPPAEPG
jgi:hypothetical protein